MATYINVLNTLFDASKLPTDIFTVNNRDVSLVNIYNGQTNKTLRELFPGIEVGKTYTISTTIEFDGTVNENQTPGKITLVGIKPLLSRQVVSGATVKQAFTVDNAIELDTLVTFNGMFDGIYAWKNLICVEGDYTNKELDKDCFSLKKAKVFMNAKNKNLTDFSKFPNDEGNLTVQGNDIIVTNSYSTWPGIGYSGLLKDLFPGIKAEVPYTCACTLEYNVPQNASNGMVVLFKTNESGGAISITSTRLVDIGYKQSQYMKKVVTFTEEELNYRVAFYGNTNTSTGVETPTAIWRNFILIEGDYSNREIFENGLGLQRVKPVSV